MITDVGGGDSLLPYFRAVSDLVPKRIKIYKFAKLCRSGDVRSHYRPAKQAALINQKQRQLLSASKRVLKFAQARLMLYPFMGVARARINYPRKVNIIVTIIDNN